jgi:hypothetical protein
MSLYIAKFFTFTIVVFLTSVSIVCLSGFAYELAMHQMRLFEILVASMLIGALLACLKI